MGHSEFLRAQFKALSSVVVMMLSPTSNASSSTRANKSAGWLISNFSESPTPLVSHAFDAQYQEAFKTSLKFQVTD